MSSGFAAQSFPSPPPLLKKKIFVKKLSDADNGGGNAPSPKKKNKLVDVIISDGSQQPAAKRPRLDQEAQSGELKIRVGVPHATKTLHVVVEHTHKHVMDASSGSSDMAALIADATTQHESRELIDEAKRLELQRRQASENTAGAAQPEPLISAQQQQQQKDAQTAPTLLERLDALTSMLTEPAARAPNLDRPTLDNNSDAIFPVFVDESGFFDEFNNNITSNLQPMRISRPAPPLVPGTSHTPHNTVNSRQMIENNTMLERRKIPHHRLKLDVRALSHRVFGRLVENDTGEEFERMRRFCAIEKKYEDDVDTSRKRQLRRSMCESGTAWARAFTFLSEHGNAYGSKSGELMLSEKAERYVRSNKFRKHFFQPRHVGSRVLSGDTWWLDMFETPMLFLKPTSALWSNESMRRFNTPENYAFRELVDFEKARFATLYRHPFSSDSVWPLWQSCVNKVSTCTSDEHSELAPRLSTHMNHSPNVMFYDEASAAWRCSCAHNGTVVLCGVACHKHTLDPKRLCNAAERAGAENQSIIAAGVFGPATRARWQSLMIVCDALDSPMHSRLLVKTFIEAMQLDEHMTKLLPCLLEFSTKPRAGWTIGKQHDALIDFWNASNTRDRFVSADSHARERFDLFDPVAMTLALLLFVEATQTVGWQNAWRLWNNAMACHCNACPFCANQLSESFYRLVVYNAMLPVLPITMSAVIENLAQQTRCNREIFRKH